MPVAILCSGQGHQNSAMFSLTERAPEADELFAYCANLLGGVDPRELVKRESIETLHGNRTGQILCTLQALATFETFKSYLPSQMIVAGYSVGEVAAWGIAGLFSPKETLDLVARRAEIMDAESTPGDGLLFIRGLSRNAVDILCARYGAAISIINPGDAFIVGGRRPALDAIAEAARAANAQRVAFIQVMVASHTSLLSKAADDFRDVLLAAVCSPQSPEVRLISGIDGATVVDARTGLAKLARQVSQTVLWSECLSSCVEAGATSFLEFGPGRALSEMVASSYPDFPSRSVDEFSSVAGVVNWIGSHGVP